VAYHGRSSSIRLSGTNPIRPHGQWKDADGSVRFGVVEAMDYELELAAFVAQGNPLSTPVPIADAAQYLFGFSLLNDWSAKSIQWWEQVLGPFLGKSFHTSLAPWVVTNEALTPFRTAACVRPEGDPQPLAHLNAPFDQQHGAFDISLEAWLSTDAMRRAGSSGTRITATNAKSLYWTFAQMLAHHTSNGCNLQPGDLLGSGTISGIERSSMACMTEMTNAGKDPITLDNGEQRLWLQDADEVVFRGKARRDGFVSIGFGECRGRVSPAAPWPSSQA
jgi:fumarylacetoacetase